MLENIPLKLLVSVKMPEVVFVIVTVRRRFTAMQITGNCHKLSILETFTKLSCQNDFRYILKDA